MQHQSRFFLLLQAFCAVLSTTFAARATDVLSYHNDAQSTGQNLTETALTTTSVNSSSFAKRFTTVVDGQVYAQPLYRAAVNVTTGPNAGVHDLVFVATENDSVYAIDAISGSIVWQTSFLTTATAVAGATTITPVPQADVDSTDITPQIGITGTPVIDPSTNDLYVAAKTKQIIAGNTSAPHYDYTLLKIDITNGNATPNANILSYNLFADTTDSNGTYTERTNASPTAAQDPFVVGTGYSSEAVTLNGQSRVYFNALRQMNRPGLVLYNGCIYIAFASHGDNGPYHGWLLGFDKNTLGQTGVLNTTPNGGLGGIWQGGGIPAMDASGNFYFATGNGDFDTTLAVNGFPANGNFGDSCLKVALDSTSNVSSQNQNGWGFKILDYFTPYNESNLDGGDTDLGSGGCIVLPATAGSASHPNLILFGGKEGTLYLVDTANMGKFSPTTDNVVQELANTAVNGILDTPAFFNNTLYYAGGYNNDVGRSFTISNATLTASATTADTYGFAGSTPSISANGTTNGIVWLIDNGSHQLRAYSAADFSTELYTSDQAGARDHLTSTSKFSVATVADGHVFIGIGTNNADGSGSNALVDFGPPTPPTAPPAAPTNLTATAASGVEIDLTWTDNSNNEDGFSIEQSTDGNTYTQIATVGVDVTTYLATGLQIQTTYYYRVRAYNSFQGTSYSAYTNVASTTTAAEAPSLNFQNGFANAGGSNGPLQFNGSAALNGTQLQLTDGGGGEAGSAFAKALQNIQKFSTEFTFQLTNANADGFTFCIQNNAATALGASGGDLGYGGIANSLCIKFDLYSNTTEGTDSTGLFTGGADPYENSTTFDLTNTGINLHLSDIFDVQLIYDGTTLTEEITDTNTGAFYSASYAINIPSTIGGNAAYIGFTGGTGGLTAIQDILTWNYTILPSNVPAAPTNLTAQPASGTEIDLNWTNNATGANAASGFVIMRSPDGSIYTELDETAAAVTTYQDTGLTPGSTFFYEVYATNSIGNSALTNVVTGSTPTAPLTPSGCAVTNVTATEIDFAWTNNATNATGIRILRNVGGGDFSILATLPPTANSYQDKNLSPGVTYNYHVEAYNLAGYQDFTGVNQQTLTEVSLTVNSASVQEGTSGLATFTVARLGETTLPLGVNFAAATGSGQAISPARYVLSPATSVTIPAGSLTATMILTPGTDTAVLGTQNVTVNLAGGTGYVLNTPNSASVFILDSAVSLWKIQMFGSLAAAQSPAAADTADPANDGLANLLKYALGLNPLVAQANSAPASDIENVGGTNYLVLTIVMPYPTPQGVTEIIESTGTLGGSWTPAVTLPGYPIVNGSTQTLKARDSQPAASGVDRFIRLRVTRP